MNVCSAAPFLHRMFTQRALTCLPLHAHTFARSHLVHDNPKAVDGVIAASAPIWSFTGLDPVYDPNTFDQIVTTDATIGTCASQLKSAWPKILGGCSSCFFLPPLPLLLLLFCAIFCVRNILPRTSLHAYSGTFATGVLTCPPPPAPLHCTARIRHDGQREKVLATAIPNLLADSSKGCLQRHLPRRRHGHCAVGCWDLGHDCDGQLPVRIVLPAPRQVVVAAVACNNGLLAARV